MLLSQFSKDFRNRKKFIFGSIHWLIMAIFLDSIFHNGSKDSPYIFLQVQLLFLTNMFKIFPFSNLICSALLIVKKQVLLNVSVLKSSLPSPSLFNTKVVVPKNNLSKIFKSRKCHKHHQNICRFACILWAHFCVIGQ